MTERARVAAIVERHARRGVPMRIADHRRPGATVAHPVDGAAAAAHVRAGRARWCGLRDGVGLLSWR